MVFEEILNLAISNGLWAVLFLMLLVYVLKDSRRREIKYQETIASLNASLSIVENIKEDIQEIKTTIQSHVQGEKKNE